MTIPSDRALLRPLGQGLAVAVVLAGMALMAFAAGLVLLGAMIGLPVLIGIMEVRQRRRSGPEDTGMDRWSRSDRWTDLNRR